MNNPLFNAMTQMAMPTKSNNPLSLLTGMLNGGRSDNMVLNMAVGMLQKQNPQLAQQVQQAMQSGKNPTVLVDDVISRLNPQQMASVKQMLAESGAPKQLLDKFG